MVNIQIIGLKELKQAVERNPQAVLDEGRLFLTRGLAVYKAGIIRSPWRIGSRGGGAPVSNDPRYPRKFQKQRSGNLRDSHVTEVNGLEGRIGPNTSVAPYARFVHHGTRRMQGRPWLEYVKSAKDNEIQNLYRGMLKAIVGDLAK
jgi:HK97 gp10 family phage protein